MKKRDIKNIGVLLDWKLSTDIDIKKLKFIKEEVGTDDVATFAKSVFDALNLRELYQQLGIELPDFDEEDEDKEDINEMSIYSKKLYKWL